MSSKPVATLSLDLDNKWSYLRTHGDPGWAALPSYLDLAVPRILQFLRDRSLTITFFVVGQDAARAENHAAIRAIAEAGHEIGNHSFLHEPWSCTSTPKSASRLTSRKPRSIFRRSPVSSRSGSAGQAIACPNRRCASWPGAGTSTMPLHSPRSSVRWPAPTTL